MKGGLGLMLNELYLYSYPKVLKDTPNVFKIWHIFYLLLPAFTLAVVSITYSVVLMSIVSILYLLCFIQKNVIIRHMKIIVVFALDLATVIITISLTLFSELNLVLYLIIVGIISTIVYEIFIFIKIKKRGYSEPKKQNREVYISGGLCGLIGYFIVNIFIRSQSVMELILILISSITVLFVVISVQKLIIYLFTRNKVQANFEDMKETDEIDKKN